MGVPSSKPPEKESVRKDFKGEELLRFRKVKEHYGLSINMEMVGFLVKKEYDMLFGGKPRLERVAVYADRITILDREIEGQGRLVVVFYTKPPNPFCDYDSASDCIHVNFAWADPEAGKFMTLMQFHSPAQLRMKRAIEAGASK